MRYVLALCFIFLFATISVFAQTIPSASVVPSQKGELHLEFGSGPGYFPGAFIHLGERNLSNTKGLEGHEEDLRGLYFLTNKTAIGLEFYQFHCHNFSTNERFHDKDVSSILTGSKDFSVMGFNALYHWEPLHRDKCSIYIETGAGVSHFDVRANERFDGVDNYYGFPISQTTLDHTKVNTISIKLATGVQYRPCKWATLKAGPSFNTGLVSLQFQISVPLPK